MSAMTVEQVQAMVASGATDTEIGTVFGLNRRSVQTFRARHGIAASRPAGQTRRGEARAHLTEVAVGEHVPTPALTKKPITVAEFLLNKRKAVCPVCQLKEPVKAAVVEAKKKGERTADILEYLQAVHRVTIAPRDYQAHFTSRHDS